MFSSIQLPTLGGMLNWDTTQLYSTGRLSVVGPDMLPGDYNDDGIVDAADYVEWRETDRTQPAYNTWRANFGRTAGTDTVRAVGATAAVAEPASLVQLIVFTIATFSLLRKPAAKFAY